MAARVAAQARVRPSLTGATAAAPLIDPHTPGTGGLPVEQLSGTFLGGLLRPAERNLQTADSRGFDIFLFSGASLCCLTEFSSLGFICIVHVKMDHEIQRLVIFLMLQLSLFTAFECICSDYERVLL